MKIKNTTIDIVKGDITQLKLDAIVNPANVKLIMEQGLAAAIKKKAGESIEKEVRKKAPLKAGEAIVTKAGKLKARHVIHAVSVDEALRTDQDIIRRAAANSLALAKRLKLESIAFPALGCGAGGFPLAGSAKIITQEIIKAIHKDRTSLKKIVFCLYDKETFEGFDKTIRGYVKHLQDDLGWGPYVTVDIIIELKDGIILIERSNPPYGWALPGGFVDYGESLETAAKREAKEETSLDLKGLKQFHTYSEPGRDPRFHTCSTVFIAKGVGKPQFGDDAKNLKIVPYSDLLKLEYAFDHKEIIRAYLE